MLAVHTIGRRDNHPIEWLNIKHFLRIRIPFRRTDVFCAAAAALGQPLCEGGEALHIIPASYHGLENAIMLDGTKVLMKSGRKLGEAINLIKESNHRAVMAQRVGMEGEMLYHDLNADVGSEYFSLIIVKEE